MSTRQKGKNNVACVDGMSISVGSGIGYMSATGGNIVTNFGMSTGGDVVINGVAMPTGSNVVMRNGKVFVDGKDVRTLQDVADDTKETHNRVLKIEVIVKGDASNVTCSNGDVTVEGDAKDQVSCPNGDVTIHGDAKKDISCPNGSVSCHNVGGSVTAMNGTVTVSGDVGGSASAMNGQVRVGGNANKRQRTH